MEEEVMTHNWYITTSEFAALCVSAIEEAGYFKRGDVGHPEDIALAFSTVAPAVAIGVAFGGMNAEKGLAVNIASKYAGIVETTMAQ